MVWIHLLPGAWLREYQRARDDAAFDRKYGVDTGGTLRPERNEVVGENWDLGTHYAAVSPKSFTEALEKIPLDYRDYTFIDMGSGKGRTLLMASELPFRKIIGVEFCPELNMAARENVKRHPAAAARHADIEVIDGDATTYPIPDTPLLLFLNNPFAASLMEKVVDNLRESVKRNPRRVVVIYFWPFHAHVWEKSGFLTRMHQMPAIFDTHPTTNPEVANPEETNAWGKQAGKLAGHVMPAAIQLGPLQEELRVYAMF